MNNPSVPKCLALATLVKSCGSQPHSGFGAGLFIPSSVSGCKWTQSRSRGPHCSFWCGIASTLQTGSTLAFFCLNVCLENSIAIEWI